MAADDHRTIEHFAQGAKGLIAGDDDRTALVRVIRADYPHTAATLPRSQQIVARRLGGLPEPDRRKIVHDTAARVYGLS